jgi:uncharacterized protein (TIGR02452 family)
VANRDQRARIAAETVAIAQCGLYRSPSGVDVSINDSVQTAIHQTRLYTPGESRSLRSRADAVLSRRSLATSFAVRNETTFAAAKRLVDRFGASSVAALNFASAKNPGGGFLSGSQAQEESLARASALYACLRGQMAYYDANRQESSLLYTDHMIVSPRVPVFRDDDDRLLEQPWEVTIITAPAPNAGAVAKNSPEASIDVEPTFRRRIEHVLAAAVIYDQAALVLGAWGCGVFGNDSEMVAGLFGEFLLGSGPFSKAFDNVTFAVLDRHGETFAAFDHVFGKQAAAPPAT